MQYHLNGFRPGDPNIADAQDTNAGNIADVLIVGCGPAGLTLAAQLSQFPDIKTIIVDKKPGPLLVGQADGIACRSMEMFEAFGFAHKVAREAYWVNEVTFWRPNAADGTLHRADRIQDVEDDLSEMPHTILSQARVHDFYLEYMRQSPTKLEPRYGHVLESLERPATQGDHVVARFKDTKTETRIEDIKARFVVGCDGARSIVRSSMGLALKGDSARQLWGVMDVLAVTDFPDVRLKCAIQSKSEGSLLIIPREGGYLVRMYIELDALKENERAADRGVTSDMLVTRAKAIFHPYALDIKEIAWWSAYEIGQRVCDTFDDVTEDAGTAQSPQIFIAGDACHTHSPKAGQGMNVSMADTFNLGWKIAAVLRGQAKSTVLETYASERRAMAKELIDFDREMANLFSEKPKSQAGADRFQSYFKKHARYTAGVETTYAPSLLVGSTRHQNLAKELRVGTRFHSAPVLRAADAKPMHLGHILKADGRWRLIAFAPYDDHGADDGIIHKFCGDAQNMITRFTSNKADIDSIFDIRAVFQGPHHSYDLTAVHPLLRPKKGRFGLVDYEKVFCAAPNDDIFDKRGVDRQSGALIVVRPDQFVAQVLPLHDTETLVTFISAFMIRQDQIAPSR